MHLLQLHKSETSEEPAVMVAAGQSGLDDDTEDALMFKLLRSYYSLHVRCYFIIKQVNQLCTVARHQTDLWDAMGGS